MEQEAQPEPSVQQQQPHSQQPTYTQAPEQRNPQPQRPQQPAPQQTYTRRPSQPMPGQAQPASQRPQQAYTQHPQQPEYGRRNNSRHNRRQDRRYSRTRNTYSGQADSSLPKLNIRRSLKYRTGRKNGSCRRTNSNRTSPIRNTPHTVRRTTRNTLISRSPCWNPSIHLIRQFKTWHSKSKE